MEYCSIEIVPFVEVNLGDEDENSDKQKGDGKSQEDEDMKDEDEEDCESQMSDSVQEDDASTVDLAEEKEKQVKKTLLFAILSAVGLVFCMKMMGKLLARLNDNGAPVEGVDQAQGVVDATRESIALASGNPSAV